MSEMKSKVVTGDLSVGKNVAVGGRATIQGNTLIKGRLRVEGWLEANNVKVANKGLFETAESLRTSYPHPRDGWWALVGKKLPAPIYVGIGGDWVATGEEGGTAELDWDRYEQFISEVESMMSGIEAAFVQLTETDISHDGKLTSHDEKIAKNELREVKVEVSGNTAKLTISTLGKSVSVALPIATTNGLGLMLGSDKVKLNNAYDIATEAKTTATSAQQTANSATTNISQALSQIASLAGVVASLTQSHSMDKASLEAEIDNLKEKDASLDEAITALSTSVADNIRGLGEDIAGLSIAHSMDKASLEAEIDNLKEKDASLDEATTVLGTKVSNVNKALGSQKTELEKRIGVLAFDGYVDAQEDAEGEAIGTVWYSPDQSCFVVVEAGGITSFCVHNDGAKDWSQPRTDCLFISRGQLLVFDGENLVNWEPELMRDDITDLGDALSEVENKVSTLEGTVTDIEERVGDVAHEVSEHIAEVAIYAFNGDGPPSTSSSAYNGPAGIYYSSTEGLFYKTTSGSPLLSIPHNANGKARTDCLYRKGNVLYQYNGSTLSEYVSPSVAAELAELRSLIANLG